jgi:hypothetical protein
MPHDMASSHELAMQPRVAAPRVAQRPPKPQQRKVAAMRAAAAAHPNTVPPPLFHRT